jgi:hypothetical protein
MADGEQGNEVFGSLPHRRPGIETPGRARARAGETRRPRTSRAKATEATAQSPPPAQPGELEQIARAGLRVAGGVTSVGLRVAGRAVGGLGRVVGRH